jgi:hypothetical protein
MPIMQMCSLVENTIVSLSTIFGIPYISFSQDIERLTTHFYYMDLSPLVLGNECEDDHSLT